MKPYHIRVYILLFTVLISNWVIATSLVVTGNVSGNWNVDTVFVTGHILVPVNETLTIQPGTRIEFQQYYRLEIMGSVLAIGLPGDTILFTIRDTSNFFSQTSGRGGWSGIRFYNTPSTNDSSVFTYCRFEFSKATEDSVNCYGGAVQVQNFGKVRFSDCFFYQNYSYYSGGGIYLRYSDIKLENCVFTSNYSGNTGTVYGYGGGLCSMFSSPCINSNAFYSNASTGVGGAVSFDYSDPAFNNNRMMYNSSALGGAFGVLRSTPMATMANNLVVNNTSLFFGGGICCIRSFPVFSNLTITGNSSAYGGGFYCNDSASPKMYNSIIYGNSGFGKSVYIWDVFSAPSFYFCDIEGDSTGFEGSGGQEGYHGEYRDNIDLDPSFYGNNIDPFQLNPGSPCTDAGIPDATFLNLPPTDISGGPRIWNNRIDMGAYEFNGTTGLPLYKPYAGDAPTIYPNPFRDELSIRWNQEFEVKTVLQLTDIKGNVIKSFILNAGVEMLHWNGCSDRGIQIPPGRYFLHSISGDKLPAISLFKI
jgi:hypothetical protein